MKVVFRVDASLVIGTGHVMRCLTLAESLTAQGDEVTFICREHAGHLFERIASKGFQLFVLPPVISQIVELEGGEKNSYAQWLGCSQQSDAEACRAVLERIQPDWLVVDHYALDQVWHRQLQGSYQALMVIDDLADRNHRCQLLLDQTIGRKQSDYQHRVPSDCQCLLGTDYGLLRAEFAQWRSEQICCNPEINRLLITLGGVDQQNMTCQVLDALQQCQRTQALEVVVVMGANAPHLNQVESLAQVMPYQTVVKVDVSNMAELIAQSDVVISAAGATVWEVACIGSPLMFVQTADNQQWIVAELHARQAGLEITKAHLKSDVRQLDQMDFAQRQTLSSAIAKLSDGKGADRVANIMSKYLKGVHQ